MHTCIVPYFLVTGTRLETQICVFYRKDELGLAKFINFSGKGFGGVHRVLLPAYGRSIRTCVDVILNDRRVEAWDFLIGP